LSWRSRPSSQRQPASLTSSRPGSRGARPMSFKIVLLGADVDESWPEKIRKAVPGVSATAFRDPKDAVVEIEDADAAYGTVPPELFPRAKKLRWICASRAGL